MTDKMQSLALAPVGNLDSYIRAANAWPMLSADEERALAEKLHYHGDLEAAKTLILSHLRFVVHIARNYAGYGLPQADLIQEGNIGLMKAVDTFDSDRRARFSTYASRCIENAILSPAHFQMEKRTHSFFKAAQMRQNGFSGLRKAVTFFYFKRYHVRVVV